MVVVATSSGGGGGGNFRIFSQCGGELTFVDIDGRVTKFFLEHVWDIC